VNPAWVAVLGAAVGTFAMRASFLVVAHRMAVLPPRVRRVLRQIPPAALSALVVPAIVAPAGTVDLTQARFPAGVVAALVAWRTRNVALTLLVGMAVLVALEGW
jgi:branched-subunit amino acid transport protein